MRRHAHRLTILATLLALGVPPASADDANSDQAADAPRTLTEAFKHGTVTLGLRYRFEAVDEDRFDERAEASTLRTSLFLQTDRWKGWKLGLEAEDVTAIFDDDDYANAGAGSLNNGVTGVPVIADPDVTEINQAYLDWKNDRWNITFGRQEINLHDQRFVGAVGWRQNHQSFDALRLRAKVGTRATIDYTFAGAVNRIFGDDLQMASHLLEVPIDLTKSAKLYLHGFYLDYDEPRFQALSTATFGVRFTNRVAYGARRALRYELEVAVQEDAGDNPLAIDTEYTKVGLGGDFGSFKVDLIWEVLGDAGDGGRAFQTPLSTLHKWNGWADRFLVTPIDGLEDLQLRVSGAAGERVRWTVRYHDFSADRGGFDYGSEIDAQLVYTAPWKQAFAAKFALYDADTLSTGAGSTDTEKLWLWTSYTF